MHTTAYCQLTKQGNKIKHNLQWSLDFLYFCAPLDICIFFITTSVIKLGLKDFLLETDNLALNKFTKKQKTKKNKTKQKKTNLFKMASMLCILKKNRFYFVFVFCFCKKKKEKKKKKCGGGSKLCVGWTKRFFFSNFTN